MTNSVILQQHTQLVHLLLKSYSNDQSTHLLEGLSLTIVLCWGDVPAWSSRYAIKIQVWNKSSQDKIMTISDLIKARKTPWFNWFTCWTSLGADGTPDNLSKEAWNSLIISRFLSRIELRKSQGKLRMTRHDLALSTSLCSPSLISSQTFWLDFRILRRRMVPTLFNLLGQCFHDTGLTEWMNVIAKQCSTDTDCMRANFDICIRDCLEAVWSAGFVLPRSPPSC